MDSATQVGNQRGQILEALNLEAPNSVSDKSCLALLQGGGFSDLTIRDVRRHLDFLESSKLIEIKKQTRELWLAKLGASGTNLLEGTIADIPGVVIAR